MVGLEVDLKAFLRVASLQVWSRIDLTGENLYIKLFRVGKFVYNYFRLKTTSFNCTPSRRKYLNTIEFKILGESEFV